MNIIKELKRYRRSIDAAIRVLSTKPKHKPRARAKRHVSVRRKKGK